MRWRLKSPASPLFTQPFIQTQIKENIKAPRHWPLWPRTGEFPAHMASNAENVSNVIMQRASNAENVSIWWRHHGMWFRACHGIVKVLLANLWMTEHQRISDTTSTDIVFQIDMHVYAYMHSHCIYIYYRTTNIYVLTQPSKITFLMHHNIWLFGKPH